MFTGVASIDAKIHTVPECGCWLWEGAVNSRGYGTVKINGRQDYVHRISWRKHNKCAISKGRVLLHRCDTRRCCNPDHLYPGSHRANMRDMVKKGRQATRANGRHRVCKQASENATL